MVWKSGIVLSNRVNLKKCYLSMLQWVQCGANNGCVFC